MTPAELNRKRHLEALAALEYPGAEDSLYEGRTFTSTDAPTEEAFLVEEVLQPKVVQVPGQNPAEYELSAARRSDTRAGNQRALELGARQIVAGITRTQAPDAVSPFGTAEKDLLASRRQAKMDALRELEAKDNIARAEAYATSQGVARDRLAARGDEMKAKGARDEKRDALREELERQRLAQGERKLTLAEKKAAKSPAAPTETVVPFHGGDLVTKAKIRPPDESTVRAKAGLFNAALGGMDDLETALGEFVKAPSPEAKNNISSRLQVVATAMNSALDQGAMAEGERRAIEAALGGDVLSPQGVAALFSSATGDPEAGKTLLSKVRAARAQLQKAGQEKFRAYQFEFRPSGGGGGAKAPAAGARLMRLPSGEMVEVED